MKISEYFDRQKRESAKLAEALAAHMATKDEMQLQYDAADEKCIALAAKLRACLDAGSPRAISIDAELRKLRSQRDGIRSKFFRTRDDLQRKLEGFTREPIRKFCEQNYERLAGLPALYLFERVEPSHNLDGKRLRHGVRVTHNADALDRARDAIFAGVRAVRDMRYCNLEDVEMRIKKLRREFDDFDCSTMQIEEVSEAVAREMRPQEPNNTPLPMAIHVGGPGSEVLILGEDEKARIGRKLDSLRKESDSYPA